MTKTVLFQFDSIEDRSELIEFLNSSSRFSHVTNNMQLDPSIKTGYEKECELFVSGQKMVEGNFTDLNQRFKQEIGSHSASVEVREKQGDDTWKTVLKRSKQAQI